MTSTPALGGTGSVGSIGVRFAGAAFAGRPTISQRIESALPQMRGVEADTFAQIRPAMDLYGEAAERSAEIRNALVTYATVAGEGSHMRPGMSNEDAFATLQQQVKSDAPDLHTQIHGLGLNAPNLMWAAKKAGTELDGPLHEAKRDAGGDGN